MRLNKLFLILIFCLQQEISLGQGFSLGLSQGITYNRLITNTSTLPLSKLSGRVGFFLGPLISKQIHNNLSLILSPSLTTKNYAQLRMDSLDGLGDIHRNSYLQMLLMGNLKIPYKKIFFLFSEGIYTSYWISKRIEGNTIDLYNSLGSGNIQSFYSVYYNQRIPFDNRRDNRLEYGWLSCVGIGFKWSNIFISTEFMFLRSISDQQKKYMHKQVPRFNQTINFGFTIFYCIK